MASTSSPSRPGRFVGVGSPCCGTCGKRLRRRSSSSVTAAPTGARPRRRPWSGPGSASHRAAPPAPSGRRAGAGPGTAAAAGRAPGEPAQRLATNSPVQRGVLDPLRGDRDPLVVLLDRGLDRPQPRRTDGQPGPEHVGIPRRQYAGGPARSAPPGPPGSGAASRLMTTGRPPCADRHRPTVDAPVPPGSGCQPGWGSHMAPTLVDQAPPESRRLARSACHRRTSSPISPVMNLRKSRVSTTRSRASRPAARRRALLTHRAQRAVGRDLRREHRLPHLVAEPEAVHPLAGRPEPCGSGSGCRGNAPPRSRPRRSRRAGRRSRVRSRLLRGGDGQREDPRRHAGEPSCESASAKSSTNWGTLDGSGMPDSSGRFTNSTLSTIRETSATLTAWRR